MNSFLRQSFVGNKTPWQMVDTANPTVTCHYERSCRRGISLLEIVISIGILGTLMAAVGHIVNQGADNAVRTELASEGIIRCESTLAEVVAGVLPRASSGQASFADNPAWTWELAVSTGPRDDLDLLEVTVRHLQGEKVDQVVMLARWIRTEEAMLPSTTGETDASGL